MMTELSLNKKLQNCKNFKLEEEIEIILEGIIEFLPNCKIIKYKNKRNLFTFFGTTLHDYYAIINEKILKIYIFIDDNYFNSLVVDMCCFEELYNEIKRISLIIPRNLKINYINKNNLE